MISVVDYGVGNLFSVMSSLDYVGAQTRLVDNAQDIEQSTHIVLPGVGAFADAANALKTKGLDKALLNAVDNGAHLLGICLGMQLLFDKSLEFGEYEGLGIVGGVVSPMSEVLDESYKIPHIGWNSLDYTAQGEKCPLFEGVPSGSYVYFVHSFYGLGSPYMAATTDYGVPMCAAVWKDRVFGMQFHPEKSGEVGLRILKNFCNL